MNINEALINSLRAEIGYTKVEKRCDLCVHSEEIEIWERQWQRNCTLFKSVGLPVFNVENYAHCNRFELAKAQDKLK